MNTQFNLKISKPCNENFNNFSPTEKGGFCAACSKEVIDFTGKNSAEITAYFKTTSTHNTCGRFNAQQLNTTYTTAKKNTPLGFLSGIGLTLLSLFSINSADAQDVKSNKELLNNTNHTEEQKNIANITLEGTVTTKEDGLPLPGAYIILLGTAHGTQTDFDGNFKFPVKVKKGDVLVVSYIGLESQKIIIENNKSAENISLKIDMEFDSDMIITGEVAVKKIFKSKSN